MLTGQMIPVIVHILLLIVKTLLRVSSLLGEWLGEKDRGGGGKRGKAESIIGREVERENKGKKEREGRMREGERGERGQ